MKKKQQLANIKKTGRGQATGTTQARAKTQGKQGSNNDQTGRSRH